MLPQNIVLNLGGLHFPLKCALKIVCYPSDINPSLKILSNIVKIPSPTAEQLASQDQALPRS